MDTSFERPFLLNDTDQVWILHDGAVDLFVLPANGEGGRRHLHRVEAGEALFGLGPQSRADAPRLLAVPAAEAQIHPIPPEHWQALLDNPALQENFADWVDVWVAGLGTGLASERPPKTALALVSGQPLRLPAGGQAFAPGEVLWVRPATDGVRWRDGALPAGPFPLAPACWLEADGTAEVHCLGPTTALPPREVHAALGEFHSLLLDVLHADADRAQAEGLERLRRRAEHDQRMLGGALGQLAGLLQAEPGGVSSEGDSGVPLLDACRRVLRASGIEPRLPARLPPAADTSALVEEVARESAAAMRRVALGGPRWWREDHGPLLAFMKADGRPVALLPERDGYRLHDPTEGTAQRVDAVGAARLGTSAVMFFRTLPARPVGLGELLRFGLAGTRRDLVRLLSLGLAGSVLGILVPFATGVLVDSVIPAAERGRLLQLALMLGAAAFAGASLEFVRALALLRVEGAMGSAIHTAIADRLLRLPAAFFRDYSAGDLAQRAAGIDAILQLLSGTTQVAILQGVFSVASLAYLFVLSPALATVAAGLTLLALTATTLINLRRLRHERGLFELDGAIAGRVFQLLTGIAKLRVAGAEARAFAVWARAFADKKRLALRTRTLANHLLVFDAAYPVLALVVLFAVVAFTPLPFGTGEFLAFNAAFSQFLLAILGLGTALTGLLNAIPLYERARPILRTPPEVDAARAAPGELTGAIELSRVGFRYGADGPPVLQGVDLRIAPGEFVAFVGPSGSGKSTLLRLLLGFERPDTGAVYYDGQDLAGLDVRAVRRQIGVVLQNGRLLPGDLFTNIVGSLPLTLDDAWAAARLAGLEAEIRAMPMGMHTVVTEGGGTLSGGQVQRLLIARALVGRPRVLLFDEATSALDNRTQAQVSAALERLNATRVVIAHRLSTIRKADRIHVMEAGRVVESGSYDELMKKGGRFAELARRQLA